LASKVQALALVSGPMDLASKVQALALRDATCCRHLFVTTCLNHAQNLSKTTSKTSFSTGFEQDKIQWNLGNNGQRNFHTGIVPLNSPGGSTLQWGTGRALPFHLFWDVSTEICIEQKNDAILPVNNPRSPRIVFAHSMYIINARNWTNPDCSHWTRISSHPTTPYQSSVFTSWSYDWSSTTAESPSSIGDPVGLQSTLGDAVPTVSPFTAAETSEDGTLLLPIKLDGGLAPASFADIMAAAFWAAAASCGWCFTISSRNRSISSGLQHHTRNLLTNSKIYHTWPTWSQN